jgi:hypothetical protein
LDRNLLIVEALSLEQQKQNWLKPATQSHGSSLPPRRSSAAKDPKIAGLPMTVLLVSAGGSVTPITHSINELSQ